MIFFSMPYGSSHWRHCRMALVSVSFLQKKMKRFNRNNCLLKQYRHQCHNRQFYGYLWQSKPIFKAKSLRLPHPLTYKCKL